MNGRWTIHGREDIVGSWNYYELDDKGWVNRYFSLNQDWSPGAAYGTDELEPSWDRWFGRLPNVDLDEWLRRPNVERVTSERFEELWELVRGALGMPVGLIPFSAK